jgi:hypothetical protein
MSVLVLRWDVGSGVEMGCPFAVSEIEIFGKSSSLEGKIRNGREEKTLIKIRWNS